MAGTIWEFFGYRAEDRSGRALEAARNEMCPFIDEKCEKRFSDGVISGVCAIKPIKSDPVICCPVRLYANNYQILHDLTSKAFGTGIAMVQGRQAIGWCRDNNRPCIAVFGKRWGGELRLPQKSGQGSYFVDWVMAKLDNIGNLVEFIAIEVQTIDTTGNYRNGFDKLIASRELVKTTAGMNWENVSKRILPQLIYKGQVLQREQLCKKGIFFVCPERVYVKISDRLGGESRLVPHPYQPAAITFAAYDYDHDSQQDGAITPIIVKRYHTTTVYRVQEAFNNVTLPEENVYYNAILKALGQ